MPSFYLHQSFGKRIKGLLFLGLILFAQCAIGQTFGGNPSTLKWRQINTDSFSIIYPKGLDSTATRIATLVQYQQRNIAPKWGDKFRKVAIVLQNQVTYSNGYVGLAPFRSEFYLMPPMDVIGLGAQNWAGDLAIHEYRHVEQYNNFDVGLAHLCKMLFGDNGQALANAAAIPDWFFEGDAVYNETLLSKQGRGRLPLFIAPFKRLYLENKQYSYQKLRNGSFKDYVPNHYALGYLLVAYGYQTYGSDFWQKVTKDAAAFKGIIYPFQQAVKKYSGRSFKQFKKEAFAYYQQQWNACDIDSLRFLTPIAKRNVLNFKYVYPTKDNSLIALKTDYKHLPSVVKIKEGISRKIITLPISRDNYFDYNNDKIVYTFYNPDSRWGYREYSDIALLDLTTGEKKRISKNKRYFTPAIANNGKRIAVVAFTPSQISKLKVLNLQGEVVYQTVATKNEIYSYPKFTDSDSTLIVLKRNEQGEMAIEKINILANKRVNILPFANRIISYPLVKGDTLYFTCTQNGKDEPWYYVFSKKKFYKPVHFSTNLYQYFIKDDSITGSVFTAEGYRLIKTKSDFAIVENFLADTLTRVNSLAPKQDYSYVLPTLTNKKFQISKYRKFSHPINFHSLQPTINDPEYSLSLLGENILNTLQTNLSYTYNRVEHYNEIAASTMFGGWYVLPYAGIDFKYNRTAIDKESDVPFRFNDMGAQLGLQLPLNFTSGRFARNITLSSSVNNRWVGLKKTDSIKNKQVVYLKSNLYLSNLHQKTVQQITPNFGQLLRLQISNTLDKSKAWQYLAQAGFYFPGILPTHSTKLSVAYQKQDTVQQYSFSTDFPFSRGYGYISFPTMWKYSIDYYFPIAYPDVGFANILYLKRLRADVFYDISFGKHPLIKTKHYASFGAELVGDFTIWNQQPISFGIRYNRQLNNKFINPNTWELILPIHLF